MTRLPRHLTARPSHGFTLIELVMVIVILGVLAAVALPRFVNIGQDARIAAVTSARGAIATAANLAMLKCQTVPGCFRAGQGAAITGPAGVALTMWNGYPTGRTVPSLYHGIKDWVEISGFTLTINNSAASEYTLDGAPDPSNCSLLYTESQGFGLAPTVTTVTTGC